MATNIAYLGDGETVHWAINLDNIKQNILKLFEFDSQYPPV